MPCTVPIRNFAKGPPDNGFIGSQTYSEGRKEWHKRHLVAYNYHASNSSIMIWGAVVKVVSNIHDGDMGIYPFPDNQPGFRIKGHNSTSLLREGRAVASGLGLGQNKKIPAINILFQSLSWRLFSDRKYRTVHRESYCPTRLLLADATVPTLRTSFNMCDTTELTVRLDST